MSKFKFGMTKILHLGHITSSKGVHVDEEKITAIKHWRKPNTLIELRGFLGLCSYYRRFIRGVSQLATPLTELTKKGAFQWSETTKTTFPKLKTIMCSCPFLAISDFSQPFIVECDPSGLGVVQF